MDVTKADDLRFPRVAAAIGGFVFVAFGIWALVSPSGFYESVATFEPYNAHFLQDIGAFQVGLGATLVLAAFLTGDALTAALLGVGVGALAHVVSHLVGLDAGGTPEIDLPSLSILAVLLLVGGAIRWRRLPDR